MDKPVVAMKLTLEDVELVREGLDELRTKCNQLGGQETTPAAERSKLRQKWQKVDALIKQF